MKIKHLTHLLFLAILLTANCLLPTGCTAQAPVYPGDSCRINMTWVDWPLKNNTEKFLNMYACHLGALGFGGGGGGVGGAWTSAPVYPGDSCNINMNDIDWPLKNNTEKFLNMIVCRENNGGGGGSGTVTSFSAGNFSPLFTTSVATATTTPALSFAAVTQNKNLVFAGPASGSAAAPTFRALVGNDIPLTLSQIAFGNSLNKMVSNSNFTYDSTNKRLSIGGFTPNYGITLSSANLQNGGQTFLQTGFNNGLAGWVPAAPTSIAINANTVGIIQPGTTATGVFQIFGFSSTNAAGVQIWGVTPTPTAGGCITLKPGIKSAANTVRDPDSSEAAITIKPIVSNQRTATFNGTGQLYLKGLNVPTANLETPAGNGFAGSAPIKIGAGGVLLTTEEPGAIETTNSHIYWTDNSSNRYQLDNQLIPFRQEVTAGQAATLNSVPVDIADLPAPGAEYAWEIVTFSVQYTFVTTDYDFVAVGVIAETLTDFQASCTTPAAASDLFYTCPLRYGSGVSTNISKNKKMQIQSDFDPTTGDGTFIFYGTARLIKL